MMIARCFSGGVAWESQGESAERKKKRCQRGGFMQGLPRVEE